MKLPLQHLELNNTWMTGDIPEEIGKLSPSLNVLILSGPGNANFGSNSFSGVLPSTICSLTRLKKFVLAQTSLQFFFPALCLAQFTSLEYLDFSYSSSIGGEPPLSIWTHPTLRILSLGLTSFSFAFPSLSPRTDTYPLEALNLITTRARGTFPQWLGMYPKLKRFLVDNTGVTGDLPASIATLQDLEEFSAGGCRGLTGNITMFAHLPKLRSLILSMNGFQGYIPRFSSTSLRTLFLDSNRFTGTLDDVALTWPIATDSPEALNLPTFHAGFNLLSGTVPNQLLWSLSNLGLSVNRLTGEFPANAFYNTTITQILDLSSNSLTGTLPRQCSSQFLLFQLHLSNNLMHGPLPDANSTFWSKLRSLKLSTNRFGGDLATVPTTHALVSLDLSNNLFSGPFPDLSDLSSLSTLRLDRNDFYGSLDRILLPPSLAQLYIGHNKLSGGLNAFINNNSLVLPQLSVLDITNNRFGGPIPTLLWTSLATMNLGRNKLSGALPTVTYPDFLTWRPSFIDISHNMLSGSIGVIPPSLVALDVSDNLLGGGIPNDARRGSNSSLTTLSISNNEFSFDLQVLSAFPNLEVLQASGNRLYGSPTILGLNQLRTIDVSRNKLDLAPNLPFLHSLFSTYLVSLNITGNSFLPGIPPSDMKAAGFVRSRQSYASDLYSNVTCLSLALASNLQPIGFFYDEDLIDFMQCDCAQGFYGLPPKQCRPCPAHSTCNGPLISAPPGLYLYETDQKVERYLTQPYIGFLASENCSTAVGLRTNCLQANFAANSTLPSSQSHTLRSAEAQSRGFGYKDPVVSNVCEPGSTGRLCARCVCNSTDFCYYPSGLLCSHCKRVSKASTSVPVVVVLVALAMIALSVPLHVVLESVRRPKTIPWHKLPLVKRLAYRLIHMAGLGSLSILVFFLQLWAELTSIQIVVLSEYTQLFNANLEGLGVVCLFPFLADPPTMLTMKLILPIVVSLLLCCSILLAEGISRLRKRFADKSTAVLASPDSQADEHTSLLETSHKPLKAVHYPVSALCVSMTIRILSFFYFSTALTSLTYFFKEHEDGTTREFVQDDPWMPYSDASTLRFVSIPFVILFTSGLPIAFVALCIYLRNRIYAPTSLLYFNSLFKPYKGSVYWWKIMDVLQKLFVSLVLRGVSSQSALQHGLVALCISAFASLQYMLRPWRRPSENLLQPAGGILLVLTLFSFHLFDLQNSEAYRLTIVGFCALYVAIVLIVALRESILGKTEYQVVFEAAHPEPSSEASSTPESEDTTLVMNKPINIAVPSKVPAVTHTASSYMGWESASVHLSDLDQSMAEGTSP